MLLAIAEDTEPVAGSGYTTIALYGLMFVAFYFLFIRPQRRRQRQRMTLAKSIEVGDQVRTASGMYGTVISATDSKIVLQFIDGRAEFDRGAIVARAGDGDAP